MFSCFDFVSVRSNIGVFSNVLESAIKKGFDEISDERHQYQVGNITISPEEEQSLSYIKLEIDVRVW